MLGEKWFSCRISERSQQANEAKVQQRHDEMDVATNFGNSLFCCDDSNFVWKQME
jgi:hypothetical protein